MRTGRRANQVTDHDPVSSVYCRHGRTGYHCRFGSERAWAEQVDVPVRNIVPLSGDADPLQLSMLGINPVTAYREAGRSQNAECRASRRSGRSGAAIRRRPWWFSTSTRLRLQRHGINCFPGSRARMFGSRSRIRRHFLAWEDGYHNPLKHRRHCTSLHIFGSIVADSTRRPSLRDFGEFANERWHLIVTCSSATTPAI